ncbi:hypothetical protein [Bradyrhizobium sp. 195]|uniref:hypothetical protein n=1 Tax=Bradyrhizobium sp. 195 TaxID=2782662 RepID=UPI0020009297|nr:hypothetical protein [Bradyrhizobium sp. 195]UPK31162.1 hypothetical protein IVB26_39085 [Bradyrhizobium sp. 195]
MGRGWTPSIVPGGDEETVYLVKDDLGRHGAVWREAGRHGRRTVQRVGDCQPASIHAGRYDHERLDFHFA